MAKICGKCSFYSAGGEETECPTCSVPLQFTLLPPPNQEAAAMEGLAPPISDPSKRWGRPAGAVDSADFITVLWRYKFLIFTVLPFVAFLLMFAMGMGSGGGGGSNAARRAFDELQVGMDEDDVHYIIRRLNPTSVQTTENTEVISFTNQMVLVLRDGVLTEKRWLGPEPKGK